MYFSICILKPDIKQLLCKWCHTYCRLVPRPNPFLLSFSPFGCSWQRRASRGPSQVCMDTDHLGFSNKQLTVLIFSWGQPHWGCLVFDTSAQSSCVLSESQEEMFCLLSSFRSRSTGKVSRIIRAVWGWLIPPPVCPGHQLHFPVGPLCPSATTHQLGFGSSLTGLTGGRGG